MPATAQGRCKEPARAWISHRILHGPEGPDTSSQLPTRIYLLAILCPGPPEKRDLTPS